MADNKVLMNGFVKIKSGKWSPDDVQKIAEKRDMSIKEANSILAYNVISIPQLALIAGVSESTIYNATTKVLRKKTGQFTSVLTECRPFPDTKGGKVFILVDENCVNFILKRLEE